MSGMKVTPLARHASAGVLLEGIFVCLFEKFWKVILSSKCLKVDLKPVTVVCCTLRYVNSFQLQLFYCMLALPWAKKVHLY